MSKSWEKWGVRNWKSVCVERDKQFESRVCTEGLMTHLLLQQRTGNEGEDVALP